MTPQNSGRQFESDLAEEFGLEKTAASGSVWHDKLDLKGNYFLWSLKSTTRERHWPLRVLDITKDIKDCLGLGGDGSSPIWAVRIPLGDFIVMRKEDFILLKAGHNKMLNIIQEDKPQVKARKDRARKPELLREEE